ncbi:NADPH-dependent FMN reductase [Streptomyces sp. NPDC058620]|uniref:NADPH-dependent FMN reductase n=1 Tax=Streptomyces sp. NPDC058620 TaxID=3346560 RepID=UPI0036648FB6
MRPSTPITLHRQVPLILQEISRSTDGHCPRPVRQPLPCVRTDLLAEHTTADLRARGHRTHVLALRDLPAAPLLAADIHDPSLARAVSLVAEADALVVATPIYKAAYSGLLKTFLDLLLQHAFTGKPVLPLATGGSPAHALALDYALRPVLTALGAQVCQGRFILDRHITTAPDGAMTGCIGHGTIVGGFGERLRG